MMSANLAHLGSQIVYFCYIASDASSRFLIKIINAIVLAVFFFDYTE